MVHISHDTTATTPDCSAIRQKAKNSLWFGMWLWYSVEWNADTITDRRCNSDILKCNWLQYGNNDDCKMEEAILGRGDGQMGLSCLFKALSSLFCCQLEFVLYVLIRWLFQIVKEYQDLFLVKSTRAPFEYSWRGVNIEGPRTVRCQCFSNSWSKPFVLS